MFVLRSPLVFIIMFNITVQSCSAGLLGKSFFNMFGPLFSPAVTCKAEDSEGNVYIFNKENSQSIVFGSDMVNVVTVVRNCQLATVKCYVRKQQIFFDTRFCPPEILLEELPEKLLREAAKKKEIFGNETFCKPQFSWRTMFNEAKFST